MRSAEGWVGRWVEVCGTSEPQILKVEIGRQIGAKQTRAEDEKQILHCAKAENLSISLAIGH